MKKLLIGFLTIFVFLNPQSAFAASKIYGFTALTGGGSGALDAIDGTALQNQDMAVGVVGGISYTYYLNSTSGVSESSPLVIVPDTNPGTKRWVRGSITNDYTVDALSYGETFTRATIEAAAVSIGTTNLTTLLLRPGTWVISSNLDLSAYTNITLDIVPGAILQIATGTTTTIGRMDEYGLHQRFNCVGTGKIVFTQGAITVAYPEWWGVDGTADDVQLNAANNAAQNIEWVAERYYIAAPIYPISGNHIQGRGDGVTTLDWTGGSSTHGKIEVLDADNVYLSDFTIDAQSADGTVGTGNSCGIIIDNGSSNVVVERVHLYDCYKHGLLVNTGSDIHVNKLKISTGCKSSAILIGQFPASYGLTTNKDCKDVFLNDIVIDHVKSDGLGIWNCSGGDGFSSVCQKINTNGLIIRDWGRSALSYAYWGSGVTTYASDVNLVNFNFDNSDYAASPLGDGRGLHLESGHRWTHTNGTMQNLRKGDGSLTGGGYGITLTNGVAKDIAYSNIIMDNCTIGVSTLSTDSTDVSFTNVAVKNSCYISYYLSGVRYRLTNCSAYQPTGFVDHAMQLISTGGIVDNFIINDFTAYVVHANPTKAIQIQGTGTINNVQIGKLNAYTDYGVTIPDFLKRKYVHGTKITHKLREVVAAGTNYVLPVIVAGDQPGGRISLLNASLNFGASLVLDPTDWNAYYLKKYDSAGLNPVQTAYIYTSATNFGTALVPHEFPVDGYAPTQMKVGEILTLEKTHAGAGKAEADGVLTLEYVQY